MPTSTVQQNKSRDIDPKGQSALRLRPRVVLFCGTGYVFDEFFRSLISEKGREWEIVVLFADFYLSQTVRSAVDEFTSRGLISEYLIVPGLQDGNSALKYHKAISSLLKTMESKKCDLLLLGTETYPVDRYLLHYARSKKILSVLITTSTVWRTLLAARPINGKRDLWKGAKRLLRKVLQNLKISGYVFKNFYFYPLFFKQTVFVRNKYDDLVFSAGRSDAVICFYDKEAEAVRKVVRGNGNIHLAKHPAFGLCHCRQIDPAIKKNKILVSFNGNLAHELEGGSFGKWVSTISRAVQLFGATDVVLRFHPRTSKLMTWPQRIKEALRDQGIAVRTSDPQKESIPSIICGFAGIIGGPSGSLRVSRAVCKNVFVVGLPNCSGGGMDDQDWTLGGAEGINWIKEGEELERRHLAIVPATIDDRPSVVQVLDMLLKKENQDVAK